MSEESRARPEQDPNELDCLDMARLRTVYSDKPGMLRAMQQEYSQRAQELLESLQNAEKSRDYQALEEAAHSLKGNSALIGALRVQHLAKDIETASRNRDEQAVGSRLQELKPAVARTLALLEEFLHG
jgi:HPt (histidine-containing phosphotransfer) domain-containing protein